MLEDGAPLAVNYPELVNFWQWQTRLDRQRTLSSHSCHVGVFHRTKRQPPDEFSMSRSQEN
jgi:hypothetical protein